MQARRCADFTACGRVSSGRLAPWTTYLSHRLPHPQYQSRSITAPACPHNLAALALCPSSQMLAEQPNFKHLASVGTHTKERVRRLKELLPDEYLAMVRSYNAASKTTGDGAVQRASMMSQGGDGREGCVQPHACVGAVAAATTQMRHVSE